MQKIKQKKLNHLISYQHFLKNNYLNKNKYKLKNILFENEILLKKDDYNLIELNGNENFFLPQLLFTNKNTNNIIYTVQTQYQNHLLFNCHLNYNLLYYFSKIIFQNNINKKKDVIKARIIGGNKHKILISIFGLVFKMKVKELNKNKKIFYKEQLKSIKTIDFYKLKYLNFKIISNSKNKSVLSRKSYVNEIKKKEKNK